MEATLEATLEAKIAEVLRGNRAPMRAVDVVRALVAGGTPTDKASVNKALYHGPFDKGVGAGAAPTWTLRSPAAGPVPPAGQFAFGVDGVGTFCPRDGLPRESVGALLHAALSLVPEGAEAVVRADDTEGGKLVAELATGRAVVKPWGH